TIGSQVVISGSGFGDPQAASAVLLSDTPVTVNSWSATSITITIPTGATSGPLVVSVAPSMNDSNPVTFTVTSQPLPSPWLDRDIGQVPAAGSATFASGTFTVQGSGVLDGTAEATHFVYEPLSGDGTIVARVVSVQGSGYPQAGVMIQETTNDPGASNAFTGYYGWYGGMVFMDRTSTGASEGVQNYISQNVPYWVELVRSGDTFSSYVSADGVNWVQLGTSATITMAQNVYVGLAVGMRNGSGTATGGCKNNCVSGHRI
ncbi:MAG TPA: IPT/TIG domain-containing protein, partial [Terriglobales bacterium]|nr:IPT/TIG domain-containing protein [Terriglobales bacterium]